MNTPKRIAVVTGGLSGIGRAVAKRLVDDGLQVVVGARRGDDPSVTDDMKAAIGAGISFRKLDVKDSESCAKFVDAVVAEHGRVARQQVRVPEEAGE